MKDARTIAAENLAPLLDSFRKVNGRILRDVWRVVTEGSVEKVILAFDQLSLVVEANPDTDEVELWTESSANVGAMDRISAREAQPWSSVVGKSFGWGWITMNQQGYCDGVLLSFGGIAPQLMLNIVASSIKESKIESF